MPTNEQHEAMTLDTALGTGTWWRCIGPHRGGRVVAVAGDYADSQTFYFGACAGGVWKTTDGGINWECVSDGFLKTAAVGAVAVAPSDANVLYVGTGESTIRGNVSHGDGVYKSTDAGRTWANVGLTDTRHIAKIRIHPANPDIVYVAALGHAWGPNEERGVFKSTDGGATWRKVLYRDADTGAIDLSMDPRNPRVLYAALWNGRRTPYSLTSGGPTCGLFKSTDGGETWAETTRNPGLPKGVIGKIGVAVSPAHADRVYAIVEAEDGAVFRSDDGGKTWQRKSEQGDLRWRAWYYQHIVAHPTQAETVYVLNGAAWKSTDGGATFAKYPTPHGDNHDLWIDPANPRRMIQGDDGGAYVTYNDMGSWSSIFNQPTAQLYHVLADDAVPYRLYASQQDNSAISVPSFSPEGAIVPTDWFVPGGGESGYIAISPKHPDHIFGGAIGSGAGNGRLIRYDRATGQEANSTVWPETPGMGNGAKTLKYRFQWTFPIMFSSHDPDALYVTSNVVHRSTDEGQSWAVVSPDLTRNDPATQEASGGPITKDNTGAEVYGTIFAFVESPHEKGVFWAGSDDGLVHLSRDGCKTWDDITPKDLPEWSLISIIEPSPHDPATAYLAVLCYKHDDTAPYLYKTADYGATWTRITHGIPATDFARVIRADPARRGLLYAGTETGVHVSFDDGAHWQPFQGNLPVCPIHDLVVKGTDLVAATHGRSLWILDDLTPLHQLGEVGKSESREVGEKTDPPPTLRLSDSPTSHLFAPRDWVRLRQYKGFGGEPTEGGYGYRWAGPLVVTYTKETKPDGTTSERLINAGENPPDGVLVRYYLKETPAAPISLTFLDADGKEIRTFKIKEEKKAEGSGQKTDAQQSAASEPSPVAGEEAASTQHAEEEGPFISADAGMNRFVWDTRYPDATKIKGDKGTEDALAGPKVVPGAYQVRLTVGAETQTVPFRIVQDPRIAVSPRDLQAQFDLLLAIRDKLSETNQAILNLRDLRAQAEGWEKRLGGQGAGDRGQGTDSAQYAELVAAAKALREKAKAIEDELIHEKADSPLQFPTKLNAKLASLAGFVDPADVAPSAQAREVFADLSKRIDAHLRAMDDLLEADVSAFNRRVREANIAAIPAKQ